MSYEKLIRSWHTKASEEDYFSKFMFEYLAFIAYVKTKYSNGNPQDRPAIQALKRDATIKNQYLEKVRTNNLLKSDWEKVKEKLEQTSLVNSSRDPDNTEEIKFWNCSVDHSNQKTHEEIEKTSGVLHTLEDWENMVEFWYSIRNNLFHGTKDPEIERDKFVVEYAYKTLKQLVEIFIENLESNNRAVAT